MGVQLGREMQTPRNVLLYGDLGMGKTILAKGIICGLGVKDPDDVVSPTFTLIQEYRVGERVIEHIDLYRVDRPADIEALGIEEMMNDGGMYVIVEWAEKLPDQNVPRSLSIHIEDLGDNQRALQVETS